MAYMGVHVIWSGLCIMTPTGIPTIIGYQRFYSWKPVFGDEIIWK